MARNPGSEYLCRQCWQVLCGQPWPEVPEAGTHGLNPGEPAGFNRPPLDQRQQQQHGIGFSYAGPMNAPSGNAAALLQLQQQRAAAAAAASQRVHGGLAAGAQGMQGRRSQSFADVHGQLHPQGISISAVRTHAPWHPSSMPEQPGILGSADDPRWGALASADNPNYRGRMPIGASAPAHAGPLGAAPAFSPLEVRQ